MIKDAQLHFMVRKVGKENNVEKQTIFLARTVHHLIGKRVLLLRHSLKELSTHATLNCFAQIFWPIVAMLYCCCLY